MDLESQSQISLNDRLSQRILDILKTEMAKTETQQKIRCAVDPVVTHITGVIQPYVLIVIIIITLILACQGYIIHRVWMLQKNFR